MITIVWSTEIIDDNPFSGGETLYFYDEEGNIVETIEPQPPQYVQQGTWYKDGVEQGIIKTPCDLNKNRILSDEVIIESLHG